MKKESKRRGGGGDLQFSSSGFSSASLFEDRELIRLNQRESEHLREGKGKGSGCKVSGKEDY